MKTRQILWFGALAFGLGTVVEILSACRNHKTTAADADASTASEATNAPSSSENMLPPLSGDWYVRLELDGFGPAGVSVPLGTTTPRPVVVGVHARRDRPEWACGEWRGITNAQPFILCPHGTPVDAGPSEGLAFSGADATEREIKAGLSALRARFGRYIAEGPMVYAGFSLGAILGPELVARDPVSFPVVVLGEGGQAQWTVDRITRFAKGGGKRVLFLCSTGVCEMDTALPLRLLERAGVQVRLVTAGHLGHLVDDRVVTTARAVWPWVMGETDAGP